MKGIFIFLLLFSHMSFAHVTEKGQVTRIIAEGSNVISVWLVGSDNNRLCNGGGRWTLSAGDPLFQVKYALLLSASAQIKKVMLLHFEGAECGNWNYYVDATV